MWVLLLHRVSCVPDGKPWVIISCTVVVQSGLFVQFLAVEPVGRIVVHIGTLLQEHLAVGQVVKLLSDVAGGISNQRRTAQVVAVVEVAVAVVVNVLRTAGAAGGTAAFAVSISRVGVCQHPVMAHAGL